MAQRIFSSPQSRRVTGHFELVVLNQHAILWLSFSLEIEEQEGDCTLSDRQVSWQSDHQIPTLVDALGKLAKFALLPGQSHNSIGVETLIDDFTNCCPDCRKGPRQQRHPQQSQKAGDTLTVIPYGITSSIRTP